VLEGIDDEEVSEEMQAALQLVTPTPGSAFLAVAEDGSLLLIMGGLTEEEAFAAVEAAEAVSRTGAPLQ